MGSPIRWRVRWHRDLLGHEVELLRTSASEEVWLDNDCLRKFTVRVYRAREDMDPL
ncbi:hypothetical protein [Mycolicibacterium conceptionense]|uniref:hypothetical protein n=1 Tax=Mycolicibacterium conceptionense TaxID=451644 RepID=UPI00320493F7